MTGVLVKSDSGWPCYKGAVEDDKWLCCLPTKNDAIEYGVKNGCTSFILGRKTK